VWKTTWRAASDGTSDEKERVNGQKQGKGRNRKGRVGRGATLKIEGTILTADQPWAGKSKTPSTHTLEMAFGTPISRLCKSRSCYWRGADALGPASAIGCTARTSIHLQFGLCVPWLTAGTGRDVPWVRPGHGFDAVHSGRTRCFHGDMAHSAMPGPGTANEILKTGAAVSWTEAAIGVTVGA
jgi:hypothetical protein